MKTFFSRILPLVMLVALLTLTGCPTKEVTSAKVYISQNNWDKAIEQLEQAIQITPKDPEAHYLLGEGYGNKGMWDKMNQMFNASLALAPTFATQIKNTREKYWVSSFNQGVSKVNAKEGQTADLEGAINEFASAIQIDPSRVEAYKNLAYSYLRSNNTPSAIATYEKYLTVNPREVTILNEVTRLYMEAKDYSKAEETAQRTLAIDAANLDAISNLAMAYDLGGQNDKALATYETALAKNPNDQDLLFNLARLHYLNKEYDKAIELFQKVITLNPEDYDANLNVGNAYLTMADDLRKSLVEKETAKQTVSDADVAKLKDFYKAAIPFLEKAIAVKSDNSAIYYNLGVAYINIGDQTKGAEFFNKAEQLRK
ncbi:MAG TPA: tetratricopeptide repeat protein [bacterium]|nr:tetratricopeptide repeat protein [bacterium]HQG44503.1 tetratricopeptide repeat protein [bacterium]HQI47798.1 tetratricopeptide repeat protein [bacterium]HQJ65421.1 tetratricopeptide repeat protein [bacterium]